MLAAATPSWRRRPAGGSSAPTPHSPPPAPRAAAASPRSDPTVVLDPLRDQVGDLVVVPRPAAPSPPPAHRPASCGLDDPLHRLVGRAADRGRTPIAAHVSIGGNHVHSFPRVLQWSPLRGDGGWLAPPPSPRRASRLATTRRNEEWGLLPGQNRGLRPGHQWGLFHGHGHLNLVLSVTRTASYTAHQVFTNYGTWAAIAAGSVAAIGWLRRSFSTRSKNPPCHVHHRGITPQPPESGAERESRNEGIACPWV